ncbi:DUF4430 domain-containing protein [Streptococcus ictaluri]|uniref:Lipoprotein n=1 Tax=Streptococcus ictaluri 707-05 TaxID=764299 RepID=G5K280_9STRE|nr:DUF4430 domain-containing protein [Streptococcus ictaluri]EHI70299.1 putative lipoprotein [Streptococcus ictaluri 707-05]
MKKGFKTLLLTVLSLSLVACSQGNNASQESKKTVANQQVRLIVKEDQDTIDEKVAFDKGETVLEVLKENYKVQEKDGFITAIDGIEQDTKAQKYWFFKVNGKMADKGANQLKVKDGDKIEFYQEVVK